MIKWAFTTLTIALAAAWLLSRWVALDLTTGTRLIVTLDQGAVVFVQAQTPAPFDLDAIANDEDQQAWQWRFATEPHTTIIPIWTLLALTAAAATLTYIPHSGHIASAASPRRS